MADIKKVVQRIYEFDLKKCELEDGNEMITTDNGNEFVNTFIKRDFDNGIIVTPKGYTKGLVYKSSNGGEFYNKSNWLPDIISFSLHIYGLKKKSFYRVIVKGRNSQKFNRLRDVTDDRSLRVVAGDDELLINEDLSEVMSNTEFVGIFRASTLEEELHFSIGKIYINNIIIDEVELLEEEQPEEKEVNDTLVFDSGKLQLSAYGIFALDQMENIGMGKYLQPLQLTGKGLSLFYEVATKTYILERDNVEDILGASFTNINYLVDINVNKLIDVHYRIIDISNDVAPNTLKQGYIKFQLLNDKNEPIQVSAVNSRIVILVNKLF